MSADSRACASASVSSPAHTFALSAFSIRAGESTYTELGVDVGLGGALLFVVWSLVLAAAALRCWPWVGASLVAVLALAIQTDVLGVPWLAYVVWALAGTTVNRGEL